VVDSVLADDEVVVCRRNNLDVILKHANKPAKSTESGGRACRSEQQSRSAVIRVEC
jgi:hypothetical protein